MISGNIDSEPTESSKMKIKTHVLRTTLKGTDRRVVRPRRPLALLLSAIRTKKYDRDRKATGMKELAAEWFGSDSCFAAAPLLEVCHASSTRAT